MYVFHNGADIPCWFELSFKSGVTPSILIRTRSDLTEMDFGTLARWAEECGRELGINQAPLFGTGFFFLPPKEEIGFAPFLTEVRRDNAYVTYQLAVPRVLTTCGGLACDRCGGLGEVEFMGFVETCDDCDGGKLKTVHHWTDALALSLTLTTLSSAWFYLPPKKVVETGRVQLLSFTTVTERRQNGGSLGGSFSPSLVRWLVANPDLSSVERAMRETFGHCLGTSEDGFMSRFRVWNRNGWLILDCPGDACGIHPSEQYSDSGVRGGYDFSCHNVDSPVQQLTLLAGLAALHDEARRAGV